ncbi:MAG: DUF1570 domain-containing protein [Planctomycetota bacterium]
MEVRRSGPGSCRPRVAWLALVLLIAAPLAAQGSMKVYRDANAGIQLRVPKWLASSPPKTGDRQVLAQFQGRAKSTHKDVRGEADLTLWVVRIERQSAPTTGGKADEPEQPKSFGEVSEARLNEATDLAGMLERRGIVATLAPAPKFFGKKPLLDADGRPWEVQQKTDGRAGVATMRSFLVSTDAEIFGLVAMGEGTTAFQKEILAILRSLRRITDAVPAEDPYAGSELRGIDRRREVRAELVPGWRAIDTENYIVVTNVSGKIIDDVCIDLEVMRAAYIERFPPAEGADMSAVSTVRVCDGYDDYLAYAGEDLDGTGGYWSPLEEELVIFNPTKKIPKQRPWLEGVDVIDVLHHEAMHQYFHYSNRHLSPSSWFNEGYGEVFGGCEVDRGKKVIKRIRTNSFRMKLIKLERKRAGAPDLATMMLAPQYSFYGNGVLENYANAWSFCYFLEMERQKPEGKRNEAWANLPQRYLHHLREATDKRRKKLPEGAPDDWIMGFTEEIQTEAVQATLKEIDAEELEKAWLKSQLTLK